MSSVVEKRFGVFDAAVRSPLNVLKPMEPPSPLCRSAVDHLPGAYPVHADDISSFLVPEDISELTISPEDLSGSPGSLSSTDESQGPRRFKHYQRPSAGDSPTLLQACEACLATGNADKLAAIARTQGIPSQLRRAAWNLLLATHPSVLKPNFIDEFPRTGELCSQTVPTKRIAGELKRMRQKVERRYNQNTPALVSSGNAFSTPAGSTPTGSASGSVNGSQETSESNRRFSDESAEKNGRRGSVSSGQTVLSTISTFTLPDDDFYENIRSVVSQFLEKWGDRVRYEPAMLWVAYTIIIGLGGPIEPELYERVMMVFCHASAPPTMGPSGPMDSAVTDQMFEFTAGLRALLPELSAYFDSEDVLSSIGGDEWLGWWIRWYGVKAVSPRDLVRVWDMFFGWRPDTDSLFVGNPTPRDSEKFICLAFMKANAHKLMDLDQSEIRQYLGRLPESKDIELVITEAAALAGRWAHLNDHSAQETSHENSAHENNTSISDK